MVNFVNLKPLPQLVSMFKGVISGPDSWVGFSRMDGRDDGQLSYCLNLFASRKVFATIWLNKIGESFVVFSKWESIDQYGDDLVELFNNTNPGSIVEKGKVNEPTKFSNNSRAVRL